METLVKSIPSLFQCQCSHTQRQILAVEPKIKNVIMSNNVSTNVSHCTCAQDFHLISIVEGLQWTSTAPPRYVGSLHIGFYKKTIQSNSVTSVFCGCEIIQMSD